MKFVWELFGAVAFARELEGRLSRVGWHVGITGSVLFRGASTKDLDVLVYPHSVVRADIAVLESALREFGMKRLVDRDAVRAAWRKAGSGDEKHVEVWEFEGRRVDLIFVK